MRRLPDADFFTPEPVRRRRRREAVATAAAAAHPTLVVSHRECLDGIGSYLVHALAAESPPPVVYAHPSEMHEVLADVAACDGRGRTLSINDLSFNREHLEEVLENLAAVKARGWRVEWRDHHHKQWEGVDTDRLDALLDRFRLDRDQAECGTSLAQQDLLPDDALAGELARIVRDRDLWRNEDPRGERYEFAARRLGTATFVDRFLATRDVEAPWIAAAAQEEERHTDEEAETAVFAAELFGDGDELAFVYGEVPKNVALHRIRERRGTRIEINMKPDATFSVRTAPGTEIAHLVGQAYGGGGHPNAAGGKARVAPWEWPLFWVKGGLSPAGQSVVRTALRLLAEHDAAAADAAAPGAT